MNDRRPGPRAFLVRRQARPAPSCGPATAPRPPVTAPAPAVGNGAVHRNSPVRACDRCHRQPGDYRWTAASRCALKTMAELGLCSTCLEALWACLRGYDNKIKQRAAAATAKSGGGNRA